MQKSLLIPVLTVLLVLGILFLGYVELDARRNLGDAQSMIDQFRAMDSVLKVGIKEEAYGERVQNLQISFDKYAKSEPHPAVYVKLSLALEDHKLASQIWNLKVVKGSYGLIEGDDPLVRTLCDRYSEATRDIRFDSLVDADKCQQILWQNASRHVAAAEQALRS